MALHTLICAECGVTFTNKHIRQRYCSRRCGSARFKKDRTRICEQCGLSFIFPKTNPDARFCSLRCVGLYTHQIHPKTKRIFPPQQCEICKEQFIPDYLGKRFCSRKCFGQSRPTAKAFTTLREMSKSKVETLPERRVREALTAMGVFFLAQCPYLWYTIDFYLPATNTALEVDGIYWHSKERMQKCDRARDKFMTKQGINVVRITDAEVKYANSLQQLIATLI